LENIIEFNDINNDRLNNVKSIYCSNKYQLKISNNDLSDINPKISILDSLVRIALEGNPLRSIKPAMRNAGAVELKKFLKLRLADDEIIKAEQNQAIVLQIPGASTLG
jgi:Leucine-rich repeat (LRR) protein